MDPEEVQHDPAPGPEVPDQAEADDAATAGGEQWRKATNPTGGEVWLRDNSSSALAAWSPDMDRPEGKESGPAPDDATEQFLRAPEQVRERIESLEGRRPGTGEPAITPPGMTFTALPHLAAGRSTVPQPMVSQHREACQACGGSGYMPSISDYLRESAALLGDGADEVIRTFYRRLFTAAPELAKLFPGNPVQGDLGTDHRGAQQREKLLAAIVALADLYDPDDAEKMDRLDRALASFGRSHAAFARGDGTVRGATWEEYGAVKDALFATLIQAVGNAWKPEYTESWGQAYDYAAAVMLAEQHRSGFSAPRFPRA